MEQLINSYPEKPIVNFKATVVAMPSVIAAIQAAKDVPLEIKRAGYVFFRNESGNGKQGFNNNFTGVQADAGRWPANLDGHISGVVQHRENKTGRMRLFCAFNSIEDNLDFLFDRLQGRGLYIGGVPHLVIKNGKTILTPADLAKAYLREWVKGDQYYLPIKTKQLDEVKNFTSMYAQAVTYFK